MLKFQLCIFIILFTSLYEHVIAQDKQPAPVANTEYIIPFQLTAFNNMSVQAILNGKDTLQLMFHTNRRKIKNCG
jgi:hypothetical protein